MTSARVRHSAFGVVLNTDVAQPGAWVATRSEGPAISFETCASAAVEANWSGHAAAGWSATLDGRSFVVEHGRNGDVLFRLGDEALYLYDPRRRQLWMAGSSVAAYRALLDSVLFTISLYQGAEALHAAAVVAGGGAVAIVGGTGGGKSTLLSELVHRGHPFLTDDILALRCNGAITAHPGPPLITRPKAHARPVGHELHDLGEELWAALPVHQAPVPVAAVMLLERIPGAQTALAPIANPLVILPHLLRYPRTEERARARFELTADLLTSVDVRRLTVDSELPPSSVADVIESMLASDLR